jgi:hypothetical protein
MDASLFFEGHPLVQIGQGGRIEGPASASHFSLFVKGESQNDFSNGNNLHYGINVLVEALQIGCSVNMLKDILEFRDRLVVDQFRWQGLGLGKRRIASVE